MATMRQQHHSNREGSEYETNHKFRFQQYSSGGNTAARRLSGPFTAGNRSLPRLTALGGFFFCLRGYSGITRASLNQACEVAYHAGLDPAKRISEGSERDPVETTRRGIKGNGWRYYRKGATTVGPAKASTLVTGVPADRHLFATTTQGLETTRIPQSKPKCLTATRLSGVGSLCVQPLSSNRRNM